VIFPNAFYPPVREGEEGESVASLLLIHREMDKPRPDTDRIAAAARQVAQKLERSAARIGRMKPMSTDRLSDLFEALSNYVVEERSKPDAAGKQYWGLRAVYETMAELAPERLEPHWKSKLEELKADVDAAKGSSYWQQTLPESLRKR